MDLADIVADTERNNLIIQSALRETDADTLVTALVGMDETVRSAFLRNVSKRTRAAVERDVALREGRITRDRAEAARQHLVQLVRTQDDKTPAELPRRTRAAPPSLDLASQRQIIDAFRALAEHVQANGLLSLEEVEQTVSDPFLRKGLGLVVDGCDALAWRSIMERHKEACLRAVETRLDMILDGLESLQSGDSPRFVEERLSAYVVPS